MKFCIILFSYVTFHWLVSLIMTFKKLTLTVTLQVYEIETCKLHITFPFLWYQSWWPCYLDLYTKNSSNDFVTVRVINVSQTHIFVNLMLFEHSNLLQHYWWACNFTKLPGETLLFIANFVTWCRFFLLWSMWYMKRSKCNGWQVVLFLLFFSAPVKVKDF